MKSNQLAITSSLVYLLACLSNSVAQEDYECGILSSKYKTSREEYPWKVAIILKDGMFRKYHGGGNLISKNYVLTSANTVTIPKEKIVISPRFFLLFLGVKNTFVTDAEADAFNHGASEITIHEQYNQFTFVNNIALMKLMKPVNLSPFINPICLWRDDQDLSNVVGKTGKVIAWAQDPKDLDKHDFVVTDVNVISNTMCISEHPIAIRYFDFDKTFCGLPLNDSHFCNGIEGSGLVYPTSNDPSIWQLRGIASNFFDKQGQCSAVDHAVFTDVAKFLPWIEKNTVKSSVDVNVNESGNPPWKFDTLSGDIKFNAEILKVNSDASNFISLGSLISPYHVVTVAHLIETETNNIPNLRVYLGKSGHHDKSADSGALVDSVVIHPNYVPKSGANNVAVLVLKTPVTETQYISKIALSTQDIRKIRSSDIAVVNNETDSKYTYAQVDLLSDATCPYSRESNQQPLSNFCAKQNSTNQSLEPGAALVHSRGGEDLQLLGLVSDPGSNHHTDFVTFVDLTLQHDFLNGFISTKPTNAMSASSSWDTSNYGFDDWNDCGKVPPKPKPLIRHGSATSIDEWPWHVAIYRLNGPDLSYSCGGTLLSKKFVITAAHCITKLNSKESLGLDRMQLHLGINKLSELTSNMQVHLAAELIVHPEYNTKKFYNDIGLIKLHKEVQYSETILPICLWSDDSDISKLHWKNGTIVGWGLTEDNQISNQLIKANFPVVPLASCLSSDRLFFSTFIFDKNYCVGYLNGTSACSGDSGGGMYFEKKDHPGEWQLRGLVSVGATKPGTNECHNTHYILVTDVAKYIDWIKEHINLN